MSDELFVVEYDDGEMLDTKGEDGFSVFHTAEDAQRAIEDVNENVTLSVVRFERSSELASLRSQLAAANEERDRLRGALAQTRVSLMEHRCGTGSCHCCRSIWAIDAALSSSPSVLPGVLEALEEAGEELTLIWAQSNPAYCNPDYTPPANTLIGRIREAATSLRTLLGRQS